MVKLRTCSHGRLPSGRCRRNYKRMNVTRKCAPPWQRDPASSICMRYHLNKKVPFVGEHIAISNGSSYTTGYVQQINRSGAMVFVDIYVLNGNDEILVPFSFDANKTMWTHVPVRKNKQQ